MEGGVLVAVVVLVCVCACVSGDAQHNTDKYGTPLSPQKHVHHMSFTKMFRKPHNVKWMLVQTMARRK